jgi:hypothetical protein
MTKPLTHIPILLALSAVAAWSGQQPLTFEPNQGQTGAGIRYYARAGGGVVMFTDSGVTLPAVDTVTGFEFVHQSSGASWTPSNPTGDLTTYMVGRDESKWVRGLAHYRRLVRRDAWPGIDVAFYGSGERLEYDFLLAPQADPADIRLHFTGAKKLRIAEDGALVVETAAGPVRHQKPQLYETLADGSRRAVAGSYRLIGQFDAGFRVEQHDPALALSIDPVLESSTFFGGNGDDKIFAINGDFLAGSTTSIDVPNAGFSRRHGSDIFVQISAFGARQTYVIGGSGDDTVTSAAIPSLNGLPPGMIVVGGYTDSRDLPTGQLNFPPFFNGSGPIPAWQREYSGGATDGFLLVFTYSNNRINAFLTYVGTPGDDRITAVGSNGSGFAAVGTTNSAGLTRNQIPIYQPFQNDPAGGIDGFFVYGVMSSAPSVSFYASSYLGGSGDDIPTSVLVQNSIFYIGGETTSPDFPGTTGYSNARNGTSDAFLVKVNLTSTTNTSIASLNLQAGTLFGGSGTDRITQITTTNSLSGSILVSGATSSTDLPTVNPLQGSYGGGASDGFFAQFSNDLTKLTGSTYLGGSGADEATAISTDFLNNIFIAGWTASQDFPVSNALQPQYGGGPDDGFLVHFESDGSLHQATFFGGSGSDRILGLQPLLSPTVLLCGFTTSPDFPLNNPDLNTLKGATDGFVARISDDTLSITAAGSAKGMRSSVGVYFGHTLNPVVHQITVTSSDPSQVQVATAVDGPSRASTVVITDPSLTTLGVNAGFFYVDCFTDSGGADLTISTAGYPDRTVHATCLPLVATWSVTNPLITRVGASSPRVFLFPVARDPANPAAGSFSLVPQPGASPIIVQIANADSSIGTPSSSTLKLGDSSSSSSFNFLPSAPGQTELTFSAPGVIFQPGDHLTVSVSGPVASSTSSLTLPGGFQSSATVSYTLNGSSTSATVTSSDSSKVVVSRDANQPGTGTMTLPIAGFTNFQVQALDTSGDVTVTVAPTGQPSFDIPVHLTTPAARLFYSGSNWQPIPISVGETVTMSPGLGGADPRTTFNLAPNPGSLPLTFALSSSNPSVVKITPPTVDIRLGASTSSFQVTGAAEGLATMKLQPPDGLPAPSSGVNVSVKAKALKMSDVEVGNKLMVLVTITLPSPAPSATTITVTTGNPSLVLLARDSSSAGQPQISISVPQGNSAATFYAQGLASSGQANLKADVPGFGSVTNIIQLDPSGFAWNADTITCTLYSQSCSSPTISVFALDPVTMIPVGQQLVQPGVTATIPVSSQNPDIAAINQPALTLSSNTSGLITVKKPGNAIVSLTQPAGFTAPNLRQQFTVRVIQPSLIFNSQFQYGKNLQVPVTLGAIPVDLDLPLTITSSDPSKLVFSTDATVLGAGTITVGKADRGKIMAQCLDTGTVTVIGTMPTFNDTVATVTIQPTGFGLYVDPGSTNGINSALLTDGIYMTSMQSPKSHALAQLVTANGIGNSGNTFLPGLSPVSVEIVSSHPEVMAINGSPVRVPGGNAQSSAAELVPAAPGDTEISVVQPPGFTAVNLVATKASFRVSAPGFVGGNYLVGRDTIVSAGVSLLGNVIPPALNLTVTITSPDPANVLLSTDIDAPPAPSIKLTLIGGRNNAGPYYIHGLGNSGIYPVRISAPGYADTVVNVALGDLSFGFDSFASGPIRALLQNGPQTTRVIPAIVTPAGLIGYSTTQTTIRPGAADIVLTVTSSDPGTVAIDSPQLVFKPGSNFATLTYRPVSGGSALLTVNVPSPYVAASSNPSASPHSQVQIDVAAAKLGFFGTPTVGRDLQSSFSISIEGNPKPGTQYTISSSDPSRLLIAPDALTAGQPSLTTTTTSFWVQCLDDNGTPTINVSANGYQSGSLQITAAPSAATFATSQQVDMLSNAGLQHLAVSLQVLDPTSLQPRGSMTPRPGANLSVSVTSSDPSVLSVVTPNIQFSPTVQNPAADVIPKGLGTAILSLGLLRGDLPPASNGQLVVNVSEPSLFAPAFAIGRDLQGPVTIRLGNTQSTPASDLTVNVFAYSPLTMSSSATQVGQFSGQTTIPAGQRTSRPFYVQGQFSAGNGSLQYNTGSLNGSVTGTVTNTGFVFQEAATAQSTNLAVGSSLTLTVVPVLSPSDPSALSPLTIRAGVNPITVNVAASDKKLVNLLTPQLTLKGGDSKATVVLQGLAPGTVTLTLSGTGYDFSSPQSTLKVVVQ